MTSVGARAREAVSSAEGRASNSAPADPGLPLRLVMACWMKLVATVRAAPEVPTCTPNLVCPAFI
ncbi:hypothetical protein [Candidatus Nephthysia bennettiae]|uniref:hypothetical protein n=1 Tax=Candidatus Nephthysia bennettiae TaxID=3127016 RepID=UPI001A2DD8F1|nr:hypothetical protein [Candidatus Dormibacteraeota bacterium]